MPLQSRLFRHDHKLQACLVDDRAHITQEAAGPHVKKIQMALISLDGSQIDHAEIVASRYGPSTAASVLQFKQKRNIVNRSYQSSADNIVGKMTIATLDGELVRREQTTTIIADEIVCSFGNTPAAKA
jgi:peptidoglycan hydrolase-like protein with peptidoglycan-binding domain